jgi:hypothetical protein
MLLSAATGVMTYRHYQRHGMPPAFLRAFAIARALRLAGAIALFGLIAVWVFMA